MVAATAVAAASATIGSVAMMVVARWRGGG